MPPLTPAARHLTRAGLSPATRGLSPSARARGGLGLLARLRYRHWLLVVMLILLPASCIGAASMTQIFLQHTLTVLLLAVLIITGIRRPLDNTSYTLLFVYLLLHLVGAHYLYSQVPYDDWAARLLGFRLSDALHLQRNHYDRFVHLCFGLLLFHPARVVTGRLMKLDRGWSAFVAVLVIISFSAVYEHLEWMVSLVFAPETADSYNGQQGDFWDAQKDSALAMVGAIFSAVVGAIIFRIRRRAHRNSGL
jgi:putative membrane protein